MRVTTQQSLAYDTGSARSRKALQDSFAALAAPGRVTPTGGAEQPPSVQEAARRHAKSLILAETRMANGLDMTMATDAAMEDAQSILHDMRGLAIRSADGQLGAAARGKLQEQYASLQADLEDLQSSSTFLGIDLLSQAPNPVSFPVGADESSSQRVRLMVGGIDFSAVSSTDLTSQESGGLRALAALETAQSSLTRRRGELQETMGQLTDAGMTIQTMRLNLASMTGRSQDAEVAEQMAAMASSNVVAMGGLALQAQAQQLPKLAMNLLGS
jgi:flagellin